MELKPLKYFVAVVEHGTVSAAAEALYISQPALSRQIQQLETMTGITLFDRRTGGLHLTAGGKKFLEIARTLLRHAAQAEQAIDVLRRGSLDRITIAAATTTLTDAVDPFLATFSGSDPFPSTLTADPVDARVGLRRGADLAIVSEPADLGLVTLPLTVVPVWAYVPSGHPWRLRSSISIDELVTEPILTLDRSHRQRQILEHAILESNLPLPEFRDCPNAGVARALLQAGRGIAVAGFEDPNLGFHAVEIHAANGPLRIALFAVWEPLHFGTPVIAAIAERFQEFLVGRYNGSLPDSIEWDQISRVSAQ